MAYKTVKKMGVSPITNTIYYGNVNEEKGLWVGEKKRRNRYGNCLCI